jgi:hypothetical protein
VAEASLSTRSLLDPPVACSASWPLRRDCCLRQDRVYISNLDTAMSTVCCTVMLVCLLERMVEKVPVGPEVMVKVHEIVIVLSRGKKSQAMLSVTHRYEGV